MTEPTLFQVVLEGLSKAVSLITPQKHLITFAGKCLANQVKKQAKSRSYFGTKEEKLRMGAVGLESSVAPNPDDDEDTMKRRMAETVLHIMDNQSKVTRSLEKILLSDLKCALCRLREASNAMKFNLENNEELFKRCIKQCDEHALKATCHASYLVDILAAYSLRMFTQFMIYSNFGTNQSTGLYAIHSVLNHEMIANRQLIKIIQSLKNVTPSSKLEDVSKMRWILLFSMKMCRIIRSFHYDWTCSRINGPPANSNVLNHIGTVNDAFFSPKPGIAVNYCIESVDDWCPSVSKCQLLGCGKTFEIDNIHAFCIAKFGIKQKQRKLVEDLLNKDYTQVFAPGRMQKTFLIDEISGMKKQHLWYNLQNVKNDAFLVNLFVEDPVLSCISNWRSMNVDEIPQLIDLGKEQWSDEIRCLVFKRKKGYVVKESSFFCYHFQVLCGIPVLVLLLGIFIFLASINIIITLIDWRYQRHANCRRYWKDMPIAAVAGKKDYV